MSSGIVFRIAGNVVEAESGLPLPGLFVKAYDKDLLFDDVLGSDVTDVRGRFDIDTELEDFREFFEARPDVYFKVYRGDRRTLVHTTEDAVHWSTGRISRFTVRIPWDKLHDAARVNVELTGDDGMRREEFEVGEPLTLGAQGLRPAHAYDIGLLLGGKELFTSRLLTNLKGEIEPTVLWPQMGFDDPNSSARYTPEEARQHWRGKTLTFTVSSGKNRIADKRFRVGDAFGRPLVLATDQDGRLLNGFEIGTQALFVTLCNVAFAGPARIHLVHRHYDWQVGDDFELVTLADNRPAIRDVDLPEGGHQTTIELAPANVLLPGAYDFIVRPLRYGGEENEALRLLPSDVVGGRRVTGVVIRERFRSAKPVLGGCVNMIPIAGRSIAGAPYFRFADTFEIGEAVYAALDPGIVDPGSLGKMCALYVIPSKDAPTWNVDNSLNHLAVLGGNAAVQKLKVQAGCVNANKILVWPAATSPGVYDIVADLGNNTPDAAAFTPDNAYNFPLDIIDGYFVGGFRVIEDPGALEDFANAGNWNYDENIVNGLGLQGTVTVQDETGSYHTPGAFSTTNRTLWLRAHVYFPADALGVTDPAQISSAQPDYPLIVIVHGNGHLYTNYDFLLQHFAKNGFIAASIELRYVSGGSLVHGMHGLGRANALFQHLAVLQAKFGAKLQNNVGIMGHSRGGEAVIKAARLNQQLGLGHAINAVISLAPTDQYGSEVLGGAWSKPYLVVYGSRDGDVAGWLEPWLTPGYTVPQTGFALYDRCNGAKKSMVFVYRASHNGFITTNSDAQAGDIPDMLPPASQQTITKAYMNAFFRQYLKAEAKWEGLFTGEVKPTSVGLTGVELYLQYRDPSPKTIDDFEGAIANWQSSSIGGSVTHDATLPADPQEGKMHDNPAAPGLDPKSPHDTKGLKLRWDNLGDHLLFTIPPAHKDVTAYGQVSFRVTQKVDSPDNALNQPQNLRVVLKDSANNERAVRVSAFAAIPYPDLRADSSLRKSAMNTIRIPLSSYTIVCAGQPKVDLQNLVSLAFQFSENSMGEVEIDEIEFTN